jgi:hypothetical protein
MKTLLSSWIVLLALSVSADAACPVSDLNGDCEVDFGDVLVLGQQWLSWPDDPADLNGDERIDARDFARLAAEWRQTGAALSINEVMASNSTFLADPQGQHDDWVELHNSDSEPVDVGGMYLTDDPAVPTQWQIPTDRSALTTIPPDGYLLIWLDGDTADSGLHAGFRLNAAGDRLLLFDGDGSTVIDEVEFGEQTPDLSYGRDPEANNQWRFFGFPTPGAPNINVYLGFVADVEFSRDRGFYDQPFSVTLTTATEGATIFYTIDGSAPFDPDRGVPTGLPYTGPIPVVTTVTLRAVAFKVGWRTGAANTHTYIFLHNVIRQSARPSGWPTNWGHTGSGDYEMDPEVVDDPRYRDTIKDDLKSVPTLSLVTERDHWFGSQGIYRRGELDERPVSAELIFPDGQEGFQVNCAVMIVGGSSTNRWKMDKLSMRLKFKGEYGPTRLRFPVFGDEAPDEFNTLVVDARMNNSWAYGGGVGVSRPGMGQRDLAQYTRDQFACDIHNAMGGCSPRGRHVHLYLNGLYWGLHWLHERPDEHFAAAYFGGDPEDYDVLKHSSGRVVNGSSAAYGQMIGVANAGLASDSQYERLREHLDITDLIDYLITNYYIGNTDWSIPTVAGAITVGTPSTRWRASAMTPRAATTTARPRGCSIN